MRPLERVYIYIRTGYPNRNHPSLAALAVVPAADIVAAVVVGIIAAALVAVVVRQSKTL